MGTTKAPVDMSLYEAIADDVAKATFGWPNESKQKYLLKVVREKFPEPTNGDDSEYGEACEKVLEMLLERLGAKLDCTERITPEEVPNPLPRKSTAPRKARKTRKPRKPMKREPGMGHADRAAGAEVEARRDRY